MYYYDWRNKQHKVWEEIRVKKNEVPFGLHFGEKEEKSHLQTADLFAPNGLSDLETHRKKWNFADDNFQAEDIIIKLKERHARAFLFF